VGDAPVEVQRACEVALAALSAGLPSSAVVSGSVAGWAGAIGALQQVIDVASAAQDAAMARLAAIETEVAEDGTLVERCRGLGHAALDAPAVVSGVLNVSALHAERRVRSALRLAADGPAGSLSHTGLGGLHAAMAVGRVDAYRASVVADELEEAPPQVAASVVAALEGFFGDEDGPRLRRRCRRVLARVSPDLLVQRARRAAGVRPAEVGGRTGRGPVGGHLPLRGRGTGLGGGGRPGAAVRRGRPVPRHRPRAGQGVD